jgi:hypothetical protein
MTDDPRVQQLLDELHATQTTPEEVFLAGGLKIAYDLRLYRAFAAVRPPEEVRG